jgi:hypothetical protein
MAMRMNLTVEQKKQGLLIAFVLLFAVAFAVVLNNVWLIRHKSDLYLRWYATTQLFSEGRNLYDGRNTQEVNLFVYGPGYSKQTNFFYPAHVLLFLGPLALLPYGSAHLIWTTAGQLFYMAATWLTAQTKRWPASTNQLTVLVLLSLLFIPFFQHTIWGQFNTIGLFALILCWLALRGRQYGWAGVWAAGLTFKPQGLFLTLLFLLFWALFKRERWRFWLGLLLTSPVLWLLAEVMQPGWAPDFLASLGGYIRIQSVVDRIWNPYQISAAVLTLAALAVFAYNRRADSRSLAFEGCLILSLTIWFLVVPIEGMFHMVALPAVTILLLAGLRQIYPRLYRYALGSFVLLYFLGWLGFVAGLAVPGWYGRHIIWSELAYRIIAPFLIALLALPLCLAAQQAQEEVV